MNSGIPEQRFTALYRSHYEAIEAYVARRVQPSDVPDVVAEVFATAWRRLSEMPADKTIAWLYGVARRTIANDRRSRQRRSNLTALMVSQPAVGGGGESEEVIARMDLARAFDRLEPADQEVLRLVLWECLSASEAAVALGCGSAAFRVRLFRARQRWRRVYSAVSVGDGTEVMTSKRVERESNHA
ncbi:RNA polymerase sigma factor [Streptomyces xiamenensis]|uniref:RNA polymerase sigma factor n=1 Tax=Streptomyces xiamenensis TaxID=408015 RepID=UPI0036E378A2